MSHIFPRAPLSPPPLGVSSGGMYFQDENGKQYLDGSGGAAVSCLGHGDTDIIEAAKAQLDQMAFAHTGFLTSRPAEELAALLAKLAPGLNRTYFVSGGSEAVEAALKLARQYFVERGETSRSHVIARRQSYHGNTLGALATGGNLWRREPFEPLLIKTSHIAPCYAYRDRLETETEFEYGQRVANELEAEILRLGANNVMAFVAEPVVGATLGGVPPVDGYFKRIREICDQHGVLLILDEVMCGMGRTGSLFAYEQEEISPDLVTIAKGLGAGYQPIGAMMCTEEIYSTVVKGSGAFQHGHTYMGHPVACAAALAVVKKLTEGGLTARARKMGGRLKASLRDAFSQHPHIGDIRGRGLFVGLEIVEDRGTKRPFEPSLKIAAAMKKTAFSNGLICYPMSGTIDGQLGDHILLAPPFIMEDDHIDEIISKLNKTFTDVLVNSA